MHYHSWSGGTIPLAIVRKLTYLPTGLTLETLVAVMSSDVSLQQRSLGCPILAPVEGAPVYSALVNSPVGG